MKTQKDNTHDLIDGIFDVVVKAFDLVDEVSETIDDYNKSSEKEKRDTRFFFLGLFCLFMKTIQDKK